MPAAHYHQQLCTGHGCYPPRQNAEASSDVYVNNKGWHRVGDLWSVHCCASKPPGCHSAVLANGSTTVYVNGRRAARIGDPVSCGSYCMEGSTNVFAGG